MKIKGLLILALCALSVSATAQFTTVAPAYEIVLTNFEAPLTENGSLAFKRCDSCELQRVSVTPSTSYQVNGQAIDLADFREALGRVRTPDRVAVIVMHHLESDSIMSVSVSI